ncbi:hypothetical protein [Sansalvadorimonas verongulae]|uniref:hypothetical protein n=1 Tax=Sansalvadorimonas verongulae TaxID=2172824 RepID=UPI0012BB502F|nr:hypothetical protein [Sansalvadorimonas verongulae]MTI14410.1 hypothetical protein [Sansalvadorimonas verongulae]
MAYAGLNLLKGRYQSKQDSDSKTQGAEKAVATAVPSTTPAVKTATASALPTDEGPGQKSATARDVRTADLTDTSTLSRPKTAESVTLTPLQKFQEASHHLQKKRYAQVVETLKAYSAADIEQFPLSQQSEVAYLRLQAMLLAEKLPDKDEIIAELKRFNDVSQQLLWQKTVSLADLQNKGRRLLKLLSSDKLAGHLANLKKNDECVFLETISIAQPSDLTTSFSTLPDSNHNWTLHWKGLACFSQKDWAGATEHFRKAYNQGLSQSSPWLALCIVYCALNELNDDIKKPLARKEQEAIKRDLLLAAELGEPAALALLAESARIGYRGFPINEKEAHSYLVTGFRMDSAACLSSYFMYHGRFLVSEDERKSKSQSAYALEFLLRAKQALERRAACPAISEHPVLQSLNIPSEGSASFANSRCVMSGDEALLANRFQSCDKISAGKLLVSIMRACNIGCSKQSKVGLQWLTDNVNDELASHWAACCMGFFKDDEHSYEQAIRVLDRNWAEGHPEAAELTARARQQGRADNITALYRAELAYTKMAEEDVPRTKHRLNHRNVSFSQYWESRGHLRKALDHMPRHSEIRCCWNSEEEIFRRFILEDTLGLVSFDTLESLAKGDYPPACILLAKRALERDEKHAALKYLSSPTLQIIPEVQLLRNACGRGSQPPLRLITRDINSCYRYLDLNDTKDDDDKQMLIRHFGCYASEVDCRLLRTDPAASRVGQVLSQWAQYCNDDNMATACLYRAFWLTGDSKIATELEKRLKRSGCHNEIYHLRRVVCNEYHSKCSDDFYGTYKPGELVLTRPKEEWVESIVQPAQVLESDTEECRREKLLGEITSYVHDLTITEKTSAAVLQKHYSKLSELAARTLEEGREWELQPDQKDLLGKFFYTLGMTCHYLKRLAEAGDFLELAAERFACKESYYPAAVYCWERAHIDKALDFIYKAPDSDLVRAWKLELDMRQYHQNTWDVERCSKPEHFEEFLKYAEHLAYQGNPVGFANLLTVYLLEVNPEVRTEAVEDPVRIQMIARHKMLQRRAMAMGSHAVLPLLFQSLFVGNEHLFAVSPYRLWTLLKDIPIPQSSKPMMLPEAHRSDHMIQQLKKPPIPMDSQLFHQTMRVLKCEERGEDTLLYLYVLQLSGFFKHTEYAHVPFKTAIESYRVSMAHAFHALVQGRAGDCCKAITRALKKDPDFDHDAMTLLVCQIHVFTRHQVLSDKELREWLDGLSRRDFTCSNTCLGVLDMNAGNKKAALAHFLTASECPSFDPEAVYLAAGLKLQSDPRSKAGKKLMDKAEEVSFEPALCQHAMKLIKKGQFDEAMAVVDEPWLQSHPETAAVKAWIRWYQGQHNPECCMALKEMCTSQSAQALYRLLALNMLYPAPADVLDVSSLTSSLQKNLDPSVRHFIQVDPDLALVSDYLRREILKQQVQTLLSERQATPPSVSIMEKLICTFHPLCTPDALWQMPAGKLLSQWSSAYAEQLKQELMSAEGSEAQTKRQALDLLYQYQPQVLSSEYCYDIAQRCDLQLAADRTTALHWLMKAEDKSGPLLVRALNDACTQRPIVWEWIHMLTAQLQKQGVEYTADAVTPPCISAVNQGICDISGQTPIVFVDALSQLVSFVHQTNAKALNNIGQDNILAAVERCQSFERCKAFTAQMADILNTRRVYGGLADHPVAHVEKTAMDMYHFYRASGNEDLACEWLFHNVDSRSASNRVTHELITLIKQHSLDKTLIKEVYGRALALTPPIRIDATLLVQAINDAAAEGDTPWLTWLDSIAQELPLDMLDAKARVALSCVQIEQGKDARNVCETLLAPHLNGDLRDRILAELIISTLSTQAFPPERLKSLLMKAEVDCEGVPDPISYIDAIPEEILPAFVKFTAKETNKQQRLARLQRCGERKSQSLSELKTSLLVEIYRESKGRDACRKAALTALFLRTDLKELLELDRDIRLDVVQTLSDKVKQMSPRHGDLFLSYCRTLTGQKDSALVVLNTVEVIAGRMKEHYKPALQEIQEDCLRTIEVSQPEDIAIPKLLQACEDWLNSEDGLRRVKDIHHNGRNILLKRVKFWLQRLSTKAVAFDIYLPNYSRAFAESRQCIAFRQKLDKWCNTTNMSEKLVLTEELEQVERAGLSRLSYADVEMHERVREWKGVEFKRVCTIASQLDESPTDEQLRDCVAQLKKLPEGYPGRQYLADNVKRAGEEKAGASIKEMKKLLKTISQTVVDDQKTRRELAEIESAVKELTGLLPSGLTHEQSVMMESLSNMKEKVLQALEFRVYVRETTRQLSAERYKTTTQEIALYQLDDIEEQLQLFRAANPGIGITEAIITERNYLYCTLQLYRAQVCLRNHDIGKAWDYMRQLQESDAFKALLHDYSPYICELILQLCEAVVSAPGYAGQKQSYNQQREQLLKTVITISPDIGNQARIQLARFYEEIGEQGRADTEWSRLMQSCRRQNEPDPEVEAAIPERIKELQTRLYSRPPQTALEKKSGSPSEGRPAPQKKYSKSSRIHSGEQASSLATGESVSQRVEKATKPSVPVAQVRATSLNSLETALKEGCDEEACANLSKFADEASSLSEAESRALVKLVETHRDTANERVADALKRVEKKLLPNLALWDAKNAYSRLQQAETLGPEVIKFAESECNRLSKTRNKKKALNPLLDVIKSMIECVPDVIRLKSMERTLCNAEYQSPQHLLEAFWGMQALMKGLQGHRANFVSLESTYNNAPYLLWGVRFIIALRTLSDSGEKTDLQYVCSGVPRSKQECPIKFYTLLVNQLQQKVMSVTQDVYSSSRIFQSNKAKLYVLNYLIKQLSEIKTPPGEASAVNLQHIRGMREKIRNSVIEGTLSSEVCPKFVPLASLQNIWKLEKGDFYFDRSRFEELCKITSFEGLMKRYAETANLKEIQALCNKLDRLKADYQETPEALPFMLCRLEQTTEILIQGMSHQISKLTEAVPVRGH